jgi:hypothetical protein
MHPHLQAKSRALERIGISIILAGILALSAEAVIMIALMAVVGICALGSIAGWLVGKVPIAKGPGHPL